VIRYLGRYYRYSFKEYFEYVKRKLTWLKSGQNFFLNKETEKLVLIDTFILCNRINDKKTFIDSYFDELIVVLNKLKKSYAYLPVFINSNSLDKFNNILEIIKKERVNVLTEYQLLSFIDYFHILIFILVYPFHVIKLAYSIPLSSYISKVFRSEILSTLTQVTFFSYARYLQGKRIASLSCKEIKLISWYENQVIDKNLYKGLRYNQSKVKIFGCQLFIWPDSILNIICDSCEIEHGIVPDKVLVNGNYYLYKDKRINNDVGPSFRYKRIFDYKINFNERNDLLVVLPYYHYEIINILKIIKNTVYKYGKIIIKFHPTTDVDRFKHIIPINAKVSENDIYDLFHKSKIILSVGSGTLIEGVSVAIPAIVLSNSKKYSHNPLPVIGKTIVWDYANNELDVQRLIEKFNYKLDYEKDKLLKYATIYKEMFFCEPTEKKIIDAFEL